ncbi:MAG: hypothetical protein HY319_19595 [Armatimonadetes bacterium]|nr:hypothetical protein [Armatimonadota bacterium]
MSLSNGVKKALRLAVGTAGAAAGAVAGAVAGVAVGGALGAIIGICGAPPLSLEWLQPLHNVAGMPGQITHGKVEALASRLAGPRIGRIAGAVAGGLVGTAAGALIGGVGVGLAGADIVARQAVKLVPRPEPGPDTDPRPTYERGWGKQIPEPDGVIREDQHHFLYNNAAMDVLAQDAARDPEMARIQQFLQSDPEYHRMIQMGGWNLDSYLGSPAPGVSPATFHHFTEPFMPGFKPAAWQARQCYDKAADSWKAGDRKAAMYYLGAAVHIAQDVALPQHAIGEVSFVGKMIGHQMMENWAESQFDRLKPAPGEGGAYPDARTPEEFVEQISREATAEYGQAVRDAFRYVGHRVEKERQGLPTDHASQTDFQSEVYGHTMKRAVRLTPGFFRMFFRDMEAQGYPIQG